jgi:hypothetical protein
MSCPHLGLLSMQ